MHTRIWEFLLQIICHCLPKMKSSKQQNIQLKYTVHLETFTSDSG